MTNRSHQIQTSMIQQVNSNNKIQVVVQNHTDIELAQKLIPISNENLANACLSVLNQYTDSNDRKTLYNPSLFYSDLLNTPELRQSIIKTDQSRNISAWINQDENNTLIKDKNARKFLLKLSEIPKENKMINKKIDEIIEINNIIKENIDFNNNGLDLKLYEEFKKSIDFFKHYRQKQKVPEKFLRIYEKILSDYIPDRTDLLIQNKEDIQTYSDKEIQELGNFGRMFESLIELIMKDKIYIYMIFFSSIEELGIVIRDLLCKCYEKHRNSIISLLIQSKKVEDRMVHTIYFSQDHSKKKRNSINQSQFVSVCKMFLRILFSSEWYNKDPNSIEYTSCEYINEDKTYTVSERIENYLTKKEWLYGPFLLPKEDFVKLDHRFLDGCLERGDYIKVDL